ncbi:MAG TPA: hypothetical protein VGV69_10905 [Solirubrobacterales bacterium]|nr:hypothetical protein [Solirubrobacterales bacterium]
MKGSSTTRFLVLAAALLALALVGAGCGGDDNGGSGDAESEVTTVVEESVAFEDPATICEENFTDKALEENYDGKDREAWVEDCSDDDPGGLTGIEVSKVKVDGATATAAVSARAEGEDDATTFTVELVDEDGWKIDGVK